MRFRSYMAAGALALVPVFALAGQAGAAAAQPMFVNVDGQAVPVKAETRVVQTAVGPMKVSTWSWHSPQGGASVEMQTSSSAACRPRQRCGKCRPRSTGCGRLRRRWSRCSSR